MTRNMTRKLAALFGIVLLAAVWIGCGSGTNESQNAGPAPTVIHPDGNAVDPATAGEITGTIQLDGTPPSAKRINMAAVPNCLKERSEPATSEDVLPGDNGTLQNVVVYLQGDFGAYKFDIPLTAVTLDQKGCQYQPHVLALMTYQPLVITTSDQTSHNIHAIPKNNAQWNKSETPGTPPIHESFAHVEVAIPVKCNIHPWMRAYVAVLDSPYFAVTGKDGSFAIRNVPPGNYTLTAWQETYGSMQQPVTVAPRQSQTITLTFKANKS